MDFLKYEESQTAEALAAKIIGYKTLEDHSKNFDLIEIGNHWSKQLFDGPFYCSPARRDLPAISAVFVQDRNGNTETDQPEELGGGATDFHLIFNGLSRVFADGVLAGAKTIHGSGLVLSVWHPELVRLRASLAKSRHPVQIVATNSGEIGIESELMFNVDALQVILLASKRAALKLQSALNIRPWIHLIESTNWKQAMQILKERYQLEFLSLIGGRTLATTLVDQGFVSDLYLTTTPKVAAARNTPWYSGDRKISKELVVRKEGRREEAEVIFEHYRISAGEPPALQR